MPIRQFSSTPADGLPAFAPAYGLQRELVLSAERDSSDRPRSHKFPKSWESYEIRGELRPEELLEAARSVLTDVDLFRYALGIDNDGRGILRLAVVEEIRFAYRMMPSQENTNSRSRNWIRACLAEHVFTGNDLLAGARPVVLLIRISSDYWIFLLSIDHAYGDAYSITSLLSALAAQYSAVISGVKGREINIPSSIDAMSLRLTRGGEGSDLSDFYESFRDKVPALFLPGAQKVDWRDRQARTTYVSSLPTLAVKNLKESCHREGIDVSALILSAVQFTLSCWQSETVPVAYTRLGRRDYRHLRAIGPFYETVLARSRGISNSKFRRWAIENARNLDSSPPLNGAWLTDFLGLEGVSEHRIVSFSYIYPSRKIMFADATGRSAALDLVAGLDTPDPYLGAEKQNGLHVTVCERLDGQLNFWLRADERLVPQLAKFSEALRLVLSGFDSNVGSSELRSAVRLAWLGQA